MAELLSINHTIGVQAAGQPNQTSQPSPSLGGFSVVVLREMDCFLQEILLVWNLISEAKRF